MSCVCDRAPNVGTMLRYTIFKQADSFRPWERPPNSDHLNAPAYLSTVEDLITYLWTGERLDLVPRSPLNLVQMPADAKNCQHSLSANHSASFRSSAVAYVPRNCLPGQASASWVQPAAPVWRSGGADIGHGTTRGRSECYVEYERCSNRIRSRDNLWLQAGKWYGCLPSAHQSAEPPARQTVL
jgi:hypothetical protein